MPGRFIVFEGGEGVGKSTQVQLLAQRLQDTGRSVVVTREPGGSPRAELIRELVLGDAFAGVDPRAELLLFAAARADHVAEVIQPALAADAVVVCDRFVESTVAYQGVGRGLRAADIRSLSAWASQDIHPDLTIVLDLPVAEGLARAQEPNRLESEDLAFHESVRESFLSLADRPDVVVLPADQPQSVLADHVWAEVSRVLS
ncbi:MAG: dTMP kinase [Actinobacteria bacterium]|nr:dTMP kinase [Actinomycetota bacterium]